MSEIPVELTHLAVPIDSVSPFPGNARRGDVRLIADSLRAHGQYRPIVVDQHGRILKGNHTWRAAKDLGWGEIAVVRIEADERTAKRIVIADNRTSDLSSDNELLLAESLQALPDLAGTGYSEEDVARMLKRTDALLGDDEAAAEQKSDSGGPKRAAGVIALDRRKVRVDVGSFTLWAEALVALHGMIGAQAEIRDRLDLPGPPPKPRRNKRAGAASVAASLRDATEMAPTESLRPWPDNAHYGNEQAIAESLAANGQYVPLVVNADGVVIIGSATLAAARRLGLEEMSVVRLDVDDETALRMHLVDDRAAAVASYDDELLADLLREFEDDPFGTGFGEEDLTNLLAVVHQGRTVGKTVTVKLACQAAGVNWRLPVGADAFRAWETALADQFGPSELEIAREVLHRLELEAVPLED